MPCALYPTPRPGVGPPRGVGPGTVGRLWVHCPRESCLDSLPTHEVGKCTRLQRDKAGRSAGARHTSGQETQRTYRFGPQQLMYWNTPPRLACLHAAFGRCVELRKVNARPDATLPPQHASSSKEKTLQMGTSKSSLLSRLSQVYLPGQLLWT